MYLNLSHLEKIQENKKKNNKTRDTYRQDYTTCPHYCKTSTN